MFDLKKKNKVFDEMLQKESETYLGFIYVQFHKLLDSNKFLAQPLFIFTSLS